MNEDIVIRVFDDSTELEKWWDDSNFDTDLEAVQYIVVCRRMK